MKNFFRRLLLPSRKSSESPSAIPEGATTTHESSETTSAEYSGDKPISHRDQDRFNRWPFAERIARTLAERQDPSSVVIGVYGAWGDGKTSTLRLMEEALLSYPKVILVNFNPWQFESQDQLLRNFFSTLAVSTGRSLPTRGEELGRILTRYGSVLSLLTVGAGPLTLQPGSAAKSLGAALSSVELDELRARLEKILKESGKRVVVFIDDIDRLDRKEIQAVFKLVKLSAGFDHTSYVLAFDDEIVAAALGEAYGEGGNEAGRAFLEKIVQVPLHLPPGDELALRKLLFEGVEAALTLNGIELSESQVEAFLRHFIDGLEPRLTTPRQARLYGNVLSFALPILKGEVNPIDQMLIEGIRVFYPKLYVVIRDNREYFMTRTRDYARAEADKQRATELITNALTGTGVDRDVVVRRLLQVLFPRLQTLLGNMTYGDDSDDAWAREQRVCSEQYFDRYFRYAVPPGDVSDLRVTQLVDAAMQGQESTIGDMLRDVAGPNGMAKLITKLRRREDDMPPPAAASLALVVAQNGALVPRERQMLLTDWTFMQAAILVAHLIRRVAPGETRHALARRIIREAEPLAFGAQCISWLGKADDQPESERILPSEVEEELGREIAARIASAAASAPPYRTHGQDAPWLLRLWNEYGTPGEVGAYLKRRIEADTGELDELLDVYVGRAWGMESGLSHKSDFRREAYDILAGLLSAQWIYDVLESRHGDLSGAAYYQSADKPIGRRHAEQFAVIHRRVQEDSGPNTGTPSEGTDPTS